MKYLKNQKGLTLIELLAVIVILGIISAIAVISILNVIGKARDQAIVANSYTLVDSARYYLKERMLQNKSILDNKITYEELFNEDYIEMIKDPDTRNLLDPETNGSYVIVEGETVQAVCFKGERRNLCTKDGEESPILIGHLSTKLIVNND
ncbi:prepilin-type N-terminal cleavage/methylation domain-containing protein (plasmid) [Bacillus sp. 31A1R]|uniref:Prepilin-type N-terminal cleavage/methylation domain-containing protein n=1 Tax=Robertmurraya mangrovi TaxID=3098077 RepID=A0ABU5IUH7_9BACI|nr:prepilin-type N-terminal cleavage/methylation domain-containing protein [Bacillus sp. 31A1R]MDZ5470812.1 prepilin-type N-terminal cleavage/methylation domain-containing protein [Bacillus sp. 31A1R]